MLSLEARGSEPARPATPLLSICIPTYNRPEWLRRTVLSVTAQEATDSIELLISDNSEGRESCHVVQECLRNWGGNWNYEQNTPTVPMVENFNRLILRASGRFVLMLSDDDYILPGGLALAVAGLERNVDRAACLFGVHVVNHRSRVLKRSGFLRPHYLAPEPALRKLLTNSSFVRFPGIAVRREVLIQCGLFNHATPNICDLDMWYKVFAAHGVQCMPGYVSAYTVHQGASTMTMFRPQVLDLLLQLFESVEASGTVPTREMIRYKSTFFHQYILAGTYRSLRWHGPKEARKTFSLFEHEAIRAMKRPLKWTLVRSVFALLLGYPDRSRLLAQRDG